jgi:hypothetical protein
MSRDTDRRGVSRCFPTRAGEVSLGAPRGMPPWKRQNRTYHQGMAPECFDTRASLDFEGAHAFNRPVVWLPMTCLGVVRPTNCSLCSPGSCVHLPSVDEASGALCAYGIIAKHLRRPSDLAI